MDKNFKKNLYLLLDCVAERGYEWSWKFAAHLLSNGTFVEVVRGASDAPHRFGHEPIGAGQSPAERRRLPSRSRGWSVRKWRVRARSLSGDARLTAPSGGFLLRGAH